MIAMALRAATVRGRKNGIDFRLLQVGECGQIEALEGDSANLTGPCNVLRAAFCDKTRHRMNRSQSLVASAYRAITVLFQMVEKALECLTGQIIDIQQIDGLLLLSADEGQQQGA